MPVTGFPATLERTLSALIMDNDISSWKVAGEGDNTTVVLPLKPVSGPATSTTDMVDPVLNRDTQIQYYRRKAPCQVRRDKQRARHHHQRSVTDDPVPNSDVFKPTDLSTDLTVNELLSAQYTDTMQTQTEEPVTQPASDSEEDAIHGLVNPTGTWNSDGTSVTLLQSADTTHCDCDTEENIDGTVGRFSTQVVKSYVATLSDKSVQRRLKDRSRNQSFRKVVAHKDDDGDQLICEADDLVLEYWCSDAVRPHHMYWYVKQEPCNMLSEERDKLANLRRGESARRSRHADTLGCAARDLDTLLGLLRFYLG